MHKKLPDIFQKVLVVWLIPSIRLYFLHWDSAVLSHSLSKLSKKRSCGGCWLFPTLVCLTQQFACVHCKAESSSTQKTGDTELSWKPNFKIFFLLWKGFISLCCLFVHLFLENDELSIVLLHYENWTIVRSPRVWDGLLLGFLKENKIN